MLKRGCQLPVNVNQAQSLLIEVLERQRFHVTLFGQRRLLCVKRVAGMPPVFRIEVTVEALSSEEARVVASAEVGNEHLSDVLIQCELADIATALERRTATQTRQDAAPPVSFVPVGAC